MNIYSIIQLNKQKDSAISLYNSAVENLNKVSLAIDEQVEERMAEIQRINDECEELKKIQAQANNAILKNWNVAYWKFLFVITCNFACEGRVNTGM